MTQFRIPTKEYQSGSGRLQIGPCQQFVVNDRQLIVSMVRSALTVNSGKLSRKYLAAVVKPTLQFLLDWGCAPDLKVATSFKNGLRDFSVTMRIGELAQGVSHAYWKWHRGYSWITDFGPWAAQLNPKYAGGKSPDFVMWNPAINGLAVMESKGTGDSSHVKSMGKALRQCNAALTHPAFSRGYGCVLTLDVGSPTGRGTLHLRDPEHESPLADVLRYIVFRRSYASWFDLVGNEELADYCRQDFAEGFIRPIDQRILQIKQDSNNSLRAITAAALGFKPDRAQFDLDPMMAAAIASFEQFKNTNIQAWHSQFQFDQHKIPRQSIRFPDGTSISEG